MDSARGRRRGPRRLSGDLFSDRLVDARVALPQTPLPVAVVIGVAVTGIAAGAATGWVTRTQDARAAQRPRLESAELRNERRD